MNQREAIQALLSRLSVKRHAIDIAMREAKLLLDDADEIEAHEEPAEAPAAKRKPRKQEPVPAAAGSVNERDNSILEALVHAGGVARSETIQKAFKFDASLSESQQDKAFRNSLQRLKLKGKIGRTGDTWSLVEA